MEVPPSVWDREGPRGGPWFWLEKSTGASTAAVLAEEGSLEARGQGS